MSVSRANCHKFECLGDFLVMYASKIDAGNCCYLELFARYDYVKCKDTGAVIPATFRRALELSPPFSRYVLAGRVGTREPDTDQANGNILIAHHNLIYTRTLHRIFDFVPRSSDIFCVLDLPGYAHLRWSTMKKLINYSLNREGQRMDLLLILPVEMALLKNVNRTECESSITRFFGSNTWQETLSEPQPSHKDLRQNLGELYAAGLSRAGYKYARGFSPQRFRASLYYVIWASDRHDWLGRLKTIWNKPRFLPGEMFHQE